MPPPGSYDINHFDIAKKITQNDSAFYTNKKVPFSSTETRFRWSDKKEAKGIPKLLILCVDLL